MVDENHFIIVYCRCLECVSYFAFCCYLTQGKCSDAIEDEVIADDVILKTIWKGGREYVQQLQGMHLPKRINILWRLHMCFCDIKNGTIMYAMDVMIVGQGDEGHLGGLFFRWRGTAPRG